MKKAVAKKKSATIDRRWLYAGAILLGVLALFTLANAGFFFKRIAHRLRPPVVESVPENGLDPHLRALAGKPDRLLIPSLGIEAPIIEPTARTQKAYRLALYDGVAHFPDTAEPGRPGNAYLFGHSSDLPWSSGDYKTVFALLPEIAIGTTIYVTDHSGNAYAYKAESTRIVRPDDLSVLADPENGKRTLTVQTSYPIGTALRRFIVSASFQGEILVK